jgi:hypothetical protein
MAGNKVSIVGFLTTATFTVAHLFSFFGAIIGMILELWVTMRGIFCEIKKNLSYFRPYGLQDADYGKFLVPIDVTAIHLRLNSSYFFLKHVQGFLVERRIFYHEDNAIQMS